MRKREEIEIRDVWKSAFIWQLTEQRPILKASGDRVIFLFPKSTEVEKALHLYFDNTPAGIKDFVSRYQILRGEMYLVKDCKEAPGEA